MVQKFSGYFGLVGTLVNNATTGDWSQFGRQLAVITLSAVTSYFLPGFGTLSSNLFFNIAAHAVIGAVEGAVIGGVSNVIMGGTFADGARMGAIGGAIGGGLQGVTTSEQFQNWRAGNGFSSNRDVAFQQYEKEIQTMHDLNVNMQDGSVSVVSRPLAKDGGLPGSTTGPRHMSIVEPRWEMGPEGKPGMIRTTNNVGNLGGWGTDFTTTTAMNQGGRSAIYQEVAVNTQALKQATSLYERSFKNLPYDALNHNSNYAVRSVLYAAGATDVGQVGYRAPGFPDGP